MDSKLKKELEVYWEQQDMYGFRKTFDSMMDRCIALVGTGELDKDELKDFMAKGYLKAPDVFIESAVKMIEPEFDLWEKVYQRLSDNVQPCDFYFNLLSGYYYLGHEAPHDIRWYNPFMDMPKNETVTKTLMHIMDMAFCKSNDMSFKSDIAFLALDQCNYGLGTIDNLRNHPEPFSSGFLDAVERQWDSINCTDGEDYYPEDDYYPKDDEELDFDTYDDYYGGPQAEPIYRTRRERMEAAERAIRKQLSQEIQEQYGYPEVKPEEDPKPQPKQKPWPRQEAILAQSPKRKGSVEDDASTQWFPKLLIFVFSMIALAVFFSSKMQ